MTRMSPMTPMTRTARMNHANLNSSRAFSLIEVLIGIVVLALGLVGLAAVFPTVVRQQQAASDQANGLSAAQSASAFIRGHQELSRPFADARITDINGDPVSVDVPVVTFNPLNLVGWSVLTWDYTWSPAMEWAVPEHQINAAAAIGGSNIISSTGDCIIGTQSGVLVAMPNTSIADPRRIYRGGATIRLTDRLLPTPQVNSPTAAQPRFVWDFVTRRVDFGVRHPAFGGPAVQANIGSYRDDGVQVAVFVRRIDSGIRIASGSTLANTLVSSTRLPVAATADGVPTFDGMGGDGTTPRYSTVQELEFQFAPLVPGGPVQADVLTITGSELLMLPFAAQIGQQFLDQLGVVHKVVEVLEPLAADQVRVRLETAIRADYAVVPPLSANRMKLFFTPQIPAAVEVFTIAVSKEGSK